VLFFLSSLPGKGPSENVLSGIPSLLQNLLHLPAYGVLAILGVAALKAYRIQEESAFWYSGGFALLYGSVLELYQAFVPGRYPSWMDLALNLSGIILFLAAYRFLKPLFLYFD